MKINSDKFNLLISGNKDEQVWDKVGVLKNMTD